MTAALLLAACSPASDTAALVEAEADNRARANPIACALADAGDFVPVCALDRATDEHGLTLTLRHPDGGFRRLRVTPDGFTTAADGAERATVTSVDGGLVEIRIGRDRYRLPATLAR